MKACCHRALSHIVSYESLLSQSNPLHHVFSAPGSAELSITSVDVKGNDGDPFSLICRVLSGTVAGNVNFFRPGNKLVLTCDNKFTLTSCSTVVVGYKLMNAKAAQYKMMIESFNSSFDDGIWTCRDSGGNEATVNISSTRMYTDTRYHYSCFYLFYISVFVCLFFCIFMYVCI